MYIDEAKSHTKERLQNIICEIDDLASEAEILINEHFPEIRAKVEAYGMLNMTSSSNPYDQCLADEIETLEVEFEDDEEL